MQFRKPISLLISHILYLITALFIFTGCTKLDHISFAIKTPHIKNGVFIIKDDKGEMAYSANIKDGVVKLDSQVIQQTGYFLMTISDQAKKTSPVQFEVYLVPGHYTIDKDSDDPSVYPNITSPSPEQNELTAYYTYATKSKSELVEMARKMNQQINSYATAGFSPEAFKKIVNKAKQSDISVNGGEKAALLKFVKEHPQSITAAHIMTNMPVEEDPTAYYAIYQMLSAATKQSDEGKALGDKLRNLIKLVPGHQAPTIAGNTPDGKKFDLSTYKKKIYLVEFWKSGNELSRENHSQVSMNNMLAGIPGKKELGIISVSLDKKRDWWTSAVKDDKMYWPQYSDLKGNESINAANWGINRIPMYYLVDGNWHILEKDIYTSEIPVEVNQYLKKH